MSFGIFFFDAFKYCLWGAVNNSFGFTKSKTSDIFNGFDNCYFLCTSILEDNIVFSFAFIGCSGFTTSGWACDCYCSGGWFDTVFKPASASSVIAGSSFAPNSSCNSPNAILSFFCLPSAVPAASVAVSQSR